MRRLLICLVVTSACGRGGFAAIHEELAECWPNCGVHLDDPTSRPFPFTFDDPNFFANVVASPPVELGCESRSDLSITDSGAGSAIVNVCSGGSSTITRVRTGGNVGDSYRCRDTAAMNVVESWIEAVGGDGLQCYDPNNAPISTLNISGTTITAVPTATAAVFIADYYAVDLHLSSVLIRGGIYGLRFHTDGRPGSMSLNDVCFYGEGDSSHSFGAAPFLLDPSRPTITAWNNVRWCTIEGGTLVLHGLIPPP